MALELIVIEVRCLRRDSEGEISPDMDTLCRKISVTLFVFGSQEIPKNSHGELESTQELRCSFGSLSWDLKCKRAVFSTVRNEEFGGKRERRDRRESK